MAHWCVSLAHFRPSCFFLVISLFFYASVDQFNQYINQLVRLVGRIVEIDGKTVTMDTSDGMRVMAQPAENADLPPTVVKGSIVELVGRAPPPPPPPASPVIMYFNCANFGDKFGSYLARSPPSFIHASSSSSVSSSLRHLLLVFFLFFLVPVSFFCFSLFSTLFFQICNCMTR